MPVFWAVSYPTFANELSTLGVTGPNFRKFLHDVGIEARLRCYNAHIEVAISQSVSECHAER